MLYKIYECEEKVTPNGKKLKKLVLKADGQENTEPRVTLWSNHPQYEEAQAGGTINGLLEKKDSGTPIPGRSGNYINRTLLAEGSVGEPISTTTELMPVNVNDLQDRVKKLEDKVFPPQTVIAPANTIEYPENEYGGDMPTL